MDGALMNPRMVRVEVGMTGCCFWTWEARVGLINTKMPEHSAAQYVSCCARLRVTDASKLMFADSEQQAWAWLCLPSTDGLKNATQTGPGLIKILQK